METVSLVVLLRIRATDAFDWTIPYLVYRPEESHLILQGTQLLLSVVHSWMRFTDSHWPTIIYSLPPPITQAQCLHLPSILLLWLADESDKPFRGQIDKSLAHQFPLGSVSRGGGRNFLVFATEISGDEVLITESPPSPWQLHFIAYLILRVHTGRNHIIF